MLGLCNFPSFLLLQGPVLGLLLLADEAALARVEQHLLDLLHRQPQHSDRDLDLVVHVDTEHARVIGVNGAREPALDELAQRVAGYRVHALAQVVAAGADLEHRASGRGLGHRGGVADNLEAVADAQRVKVRDRLPNPLRRLVNRDLRNVSLVTSIDWI